MWGIPLFTFCIFIIIITLKWFMWGYFTFLKHMMSQCWILEIFLDFILDQIKKTVSFLKASLPPYHERLKQIRDGSWPDPSILLTRSKEEANPSLTRVFFNMTQWYFLTWREKIWKFGIFRGNFPNPEVADPTQPNLNQNFLACTHHYSKYIWFW